LEAQGPSVNLNSDNSRAIRFYEKQGFTVCAEVMNWRSGAQDELEAVDRQRIAA
jgi:ribosomal protein S18 acetylase RimI-like enzyme